MILVQATTLNLTIVKLFFMGMFHNTYTRVGLEQAFECFEGSKGKQTLKSKTILRSFVIHS